MRDVSCTGCCQSPAAGVCDVQLPLDVACCKPCVVCRVRPYRAAPAGMDLEPRSARYNDDDIVGAMLDPVRQLSAKYDPRNREIHDDYMDWSTQVRGQAPWMLSSWAVPAGAQRRCTSKRPHTRTGV